MDGCRQVEQFPAWFKELDTDKDGQITFNEWRKGGKDPDEFSTYDLNDDGLVVDRARRRARRRRTG